MLNAIILLFLSMSLYGYINYRLNVTGKSYDSFQGALLVLGFIGIVANSFVIFWLLSPWIFLSFVVAIFLKFSWNKYRENHFKVR